jgi:hypothetical protein
VRACDHSEPERVRHSFPVRPAFRCEGEHRLDQRLELERRAYLAEEACLALAGVPEAVRRAGRDRCNVAGLRHHLLISDAKPE